MPWFRFNGGYIFAEDPACEAHQARILWHRAIDPGTLSVVATPADPGDPEAIPWNRIAPWLVSVTGGDGREHAVLSDGWRRIRLDVEQGSLTGHPAVLLDFAMYGIATSEARVMPLRRLITLCRHGRFARSLFPPEPRMDRWLTMLRVHDALVDGASQREIAMVLFGKDRVRAARDQGNDSLRSRTRRLARDALTMAAGGYRRLLRRGDRPG